MLQININDILAFNIRNNLNTIMARSFKKVYLFHSFKNFLIWNFHCNISLLASGNL